MPHPDEGTLHALLDGELNAADAEMVRAHIGECGECLRAYEEAQRLLGASDRAIAVLDDAHRWPLEEEDLRSDLDPPPAASISPGAPIVLMPGASHGPRWERARSRSYFWAAGIAVLAGAGYLVLRARTDEEAGISRTTIATLPAAATAANDSAAGGAGVAAAATAPVSVPVTAPDSTVAKPVLLASERARADEPPPAVRQAAEARVPAANAVSDKAAMGQVASVQRSAEPAREEAAPRLAAADAAAPAAAPPPEPTLDTRAQLTGRIGLDDARRELGSPLHGIDGLRPRAIGLVPGRLVPGADPARNVVRAVYQDRDGQLFYLDQQRMAAGTGTRSGGLVVGDVQLFLHGQLIADSARAMADRVR